MYSVRYLEQTDKMSQQVRLSRNAGNREVEQQCVPTEADETYQ